MTDLQGPPPKSTRDYVMKIYDAVNDLTRDLSGVCTTVNAHEDRLVKIETSRNVAPVVDDHETRIKTLETQRDTITNTVRAGSKVFTFSKGLGNLIISVAGGIAGAWAVIQSGKP